MSTQEQITRPNTSAPKCPERSTAEISPVDLQQTVMESANQPPLCADILHSHVIQRPSRPDIWCRRGGSGAVGRLSHTLMSLCAMMRWMAWREWYASLSLLLHQYTDCHRSPTGVIWSLIHRDLGPITGRDVTQVSVKLYDVILTLNEAMDLSTAITRLSFRSSIGLNILTHPPHPPHPPNIFKASLQYVYTVSRNFPTIIKGDQKVEVHWHGDGSTQSNYHRFDYCEILARLIKPWLI